MFAAPQHRYRRRPADTRDNRHRSYRALLLINLVALAAAIASFALLSSSAQAQPLPPPNSQSRTLADPYPPTLTNGAAHWAPVAWPTDSDWHTYTMSGSPIDDPRTQDPSNGGTSPQNYVNVSSCLPDKSAPSVYWSFNPSNQTIFYRFKVEQIANTYATGPSAGAYGATDPWNSAMWTVLIDLNGDGYRDFAVQLDGSSGAPSTPIDRLTSYWGTSKNQSVDPSSDPAVHQLFHNPTAFVDLATSRILNFHNTLSPDTSWPNGSNETRWDYGTTRSTKNYGVGCNEFILDYQIPLGMLNASAFGGPQVTANTRLAFAFATSNSLNNPLQKDVVLQGDTYFVADPSKPVPFGDGVTLGGDGTSPPQPTVDSITASGCNPTLLGAQVSDAMTVTNGIVSPTIASVAFYSYYDKNGNGQPDDGQSWTFAANGTTTNNPIGKWDASWNSTGLPQGQYLIGVRATDLDGNVTWSYLNSGLTPPNYQNPTPPGLLWTTWSNTCGTPPPSISKSVTPGTVTAGQSVTFTISVNNTNPTPMTLSVITDTLPPGFSYAATTGGTLSPTTSPSGGATGDITWSFAAASINAHSTGTLIFRATAPITVGTFSNLASANTGEGTLNSAPTQVSVGSPRLTISKVANASSANPGDTITFTVSYANDSPVNVTGAVVSDTLATGITFVSAANGGTYNSGNRTVTWNVGSLAAGDGPFSVSFSATVVTPYPDAAAVPFVNTATIASNETSPSSASTSVYINSPRPNLSIQKDATATQVAPGGFVTFTLSYSNTGAAAASSAVITDVIPVSFTVTSATTPNLASGSLITWNIGTIGVGASGFVTVGMRAATPFSGTNPALNTANLVATGTPLVSDSYRVGVSQSGQVCTTYHFQNALVNVGFDGSQQSATTAAPAGAGTNVTGTVNTTSFITLASFYLDPPAQNAIDFTGASLATTYYIDRSSGNATTIRVTVYDYDSAAGTRVQLGQGTNNYGGSQTGPQTFSFSLAGGTLAKNHRLLWVFEGEKATGSGTDTIYFQYGGTVTNPVRGGTTFADANGQFCVTPPANPALDKQVNKLTAVPGDTVVYTVKFGNTGLVAMTNSIVTDTLPVGTTFVTSTLNSSPIAPAISGQQLTFQVNSPSQSSGVVTQTVGTLLVTATVNSSLSAGLTSLANSASLVSTQTGIITDTATTVVLRPNTSVSKSASKTLLVPGDIVTFTLTALNSGTGPATNVTISDTLPSSAYFTYVAGSTRLNGSPFADSVSGNLLSANIGSLAVGASASLTFQMQVALSGAPSGITTLTNTASITDTQTTGSRTSGTVTLSISTNPNLRVAKSLTPGGTLAPGDLVTYTLVVTNAGSGSATGVLLRDPIPANTGYAAGTLVYSGTPQTDILDSDNAYFDALNNQVVFDLGTLAPSASRSAHFTVRVNVPLPNGLSPVSNTVTASASNAASKSSSANAQADAAPVLVLDKTGPATIPSPAATLTSSPSGATTFTVDNASQLGITQYVSIAGQTRQITGISGNQITVASALTASAGASVNVGIRYSISYANNGNANATGVVLTDTLPASTTYIASTPAGVFGGGAVTWNIGTLSPGDSALVQVDVMPNGTGAFVNHATFSSNETSPVNDSVTTDIGSLRVTKRTTTPSVTQTLNGTSATYVLSVANTLASAANGVIVTDTLASGFSFSSTVGTSLSAGSPTINPVVGSQQPSWGTFSIPGSTTLLITFTARIDPSVGPATYQNDVAATSTSAAVTGFDSLATTDEDVRVFVPNVVPTKSVTPSTVLAGQLVTYTISLVNNGDTGAVGISITDTLPAGFTYASTISTGASNATRTSASNPLAGSATPVWSLWDIAAGGQVSVTFTATTAGVGVYSNTVTFAGSNTPGLTLSNTAPVTVTPSVDLSVSKSANPDPAFVGLPLTYTVVVTNSGPSPATGVLITDTLPATVTLSSATSTQGSCVAANPVGCAVGSMNIGAVVTATIVVTPTTSGTLVNTAATSANEPDPNSLNNTTTIMTAMTAFADLALAKSVAPNPVDAGSTLTYTLAITNFGTSSAANPVVTDTFPSGATFGSVNGNGWTCGNAGTVVTCTTASLAASASHTITLTLGAPLAGGTITNTATVQSATSDPNPGNNTATVTSTDIALADLTIAKSASPDPVLAGSLLTYTLTVTNTGPSPASGVTVTDTLPNGTTYNSANGGSWTCGSAGSIVTCTIASLAVNTPQTITLTVTAPNTTGTLTNTATITTTAVDPIPANNTAQVTTTVTSVADLGILKTHNPEPVTPGQPITYTLVVTNGGPSAAVNVTITDTLPVSLSGVTWTCSASSGSSCASGSGNINTTANILANGTLTYTVNATVLASATGSLVNTAYVAPPAGTTDSNPNNNSSTDTATLSASADISVTKSHAGNFAVGSNGTYTITVTNNGPSIAKGTLRITDTLPAGLNYNSAGGTGWTCGSASPQVTCTNPADLAVSASTSITLSVAVGEAAYPSVTNVVTATSTAPDSNASNNTTSDPTTITAAPDLSLAKTTLSSSVSPGSVITYSIAYSNTGNITASNVRITDTVPANTTYTGGSTWVCTPGSSAGSLCVHSIASVPADSIARTVVYTLTLNSTVPAGTTVITNTATIGDDGTHGADPSSNNTSTVTTPLSGTAYDLIVRKSDGGVTPAPGDTINYSLTVTNTGNIEAANVTLTETVPANTRFVGTGWSCPTNSGAGTLCTRILPSVRGGSQSAGVQFSVAITNPLPNGVSQISNSVQVDPDATPGDNTHTITTTIVAAAVLNIFKTDNGATATVGGTIVYTIAYSNTGSADAGNVVITDTVPANTTYTGGVGWNCAPNNNAGSVCSRTIGTLAGNGGSGSVPFTVTVASALPAGANPISNTAFVQATGVTTKSSSDTTNVSDAQPDLVITKRANISSVTPGSLITYTLNYTNAGNIGAANVLVTETVPANTTFAGPLATWSCSIGDGSGTACLRNVGTLQSGGNGGVLFAVRVVNPLPGGTRAITNTVALGDDGTNGLEKNPADNHYQMTTSVTTAPNLGIAKTYNGQHFTAGSTVTFTLTYSNSGNIAATGVTITDTIPSYTTFNAAASTAGWTCPNNNPGAVCTFAISSPVPADGVNRTVLFALNISSSIPAGVYQIPNTASIGDDGANGADPNSNNNTSTATVTLDGTRPDLTITKSHVPASVGPGSPITFTLLYTNTGGVAAPGTHITETVPSGTTFSPGSSSLGWTCTPNNNAGSQCVFDAGAIVSNGDSQVQFVVVASNPLPAGQASLTNVVTIADSGVNGPDLTPANNIYTDTVSITGNFPALQLTKSHTGDLVIGSTATFTLRVTNNGSGLTTAPIVLTDTLPSGLAYSSVSGSGWICAASAAPARVVVPTATITQTKTIPPTLTGTRTATPAATATHTNTPVSTLAASATLAPTLVKTRTPTVISTQTITSTVAATAMPVPTFAITPTVAAAKTVTPSATLAPTGALTPTATSAITTTPKASTNLGDASSGFALIAYAPTVTSTQTLTPTSTPISATATVVRPTATVTPTATTGKPDAAPTATATRPAAAPSSTATPTATATTVRTAIPSPTRTNTVAAQAPAPRASTAQTVNCTYGGALAPGASAVLNLVVLVGESAYPSAINQASVSTAGDPIGVRTASDVAVVRQAGAPTPPPAPPAEVPEADTLLLFVSGGSAMATYLLVAWRQRKK